MSENEIAEKGGFKSVNFNPVNLGENQNTPDLILSRSDPGDAVLQRFRYQISYAAILSLLMVEGKDGIAEVFCEHHEDILIKFANGSFAGIQIKTRDINLHPFSLDDEAIILSIKRFVLLNKQFPSKFSVFSIVSNHGFNKTKPAICIETLINLVKNGEQITGRKNKSLLKRLIKECDCEEACLFDTIAKIRVRSFCALSDIHSHLVNQFKTSFDIKGLTESKIEDLVDSIIGKHFKASSLQVKNSLVHHRYIIGTIDENDELDEIINSKRFSKADFSKWLEGEKGQPIKLLLKDRLSIAGMPDTHRRLEIKMDAGGIDSENIGLIRTLKFSFEQHVTSWLYKDGSEEAEARYSQILFIIQNLCKEVFDELAIANGNSEGTAMLIDVRARIKARQEKDPILFHDCIYEHILGAVGVLTETCKVWWSPKFNFPE